MSDKFDEISPIISNKMSVQKNGKSGLINTSGEYIIKPKYEEVMYFGGDMVRVKKHGKYGYRTTEGKRAIPIKYEEIGRFYGTRAKAKRKGKWGVIDKEGKKILKFNFEYIGEYAYDNYLNDQYAPYVYGNRVGKISSWGASVPFRYDEIADETKRIDSDLIMFRFGKDYGAVDNNGYVVINPFYKNPFVFNEGVAAVTNGEKYGFIDKKGKIVYPLILEKAENFVNGKAKVVKNGVEEELSLEELKM
ncbi:MAG: WG repeat-containing protein [Saprospiraceae bacterium]|nr:WG repeat-containing protein [Saprospiraceae bacterium]